MKCLLFLEINKTLSFVRNLLVDYAQLHWSIKINYTKCPNMYEKYSVNRFLVELIFWMYYNYTTMLVT